MRLVLLTVLLVGCSAPVEGLGTAATRLSPMHCGWLVRDDIPRPPPATCVEVAVPEGGRISFDKLDLCDVEAEAITCAVVIPEDFAGLHFYARPEAYSDDWRLETSSKSECPLTCP